MTQSKRTLTKCKICGVPIRASQLSKHMQKVHKAVKAKPRSSTIYLSKEAIQRQIKRLDRGKIILSSKRRYRLRAGGRCDECGVSERPVWRYPESNRGAVKICGRCEGKVLDRSFGRIDALDKAWSGGGFETNPRRH